MRIAVTLIILTLLPGVALLARAAQPTAGSGPKTADADFAFQGDYTGVLDVDTEAQKWGAQVVALGGGKFRAVGYEGGLPGDGWNEGARYEADGSASGGMVTINAADATLHLRAGKMTVIDAGGQKLGTLDKVVRKSPTLGAGPPPGAVVLFDGTTADNFRRGRLTDDGLLMQGAISKQKFRNFACHLEFQLPYMPRARGQGRANSGCYYQGRYEVQILDSFGLDGKDNECGGIYRVAPPRINMCYPPLSWQTYDVDFTAAVFEGGKKTKNARITVRHNGVPIHEDRQLPDVTGGNLTPEGPEPGPIYIQDHGNPVRFRNIWLVEE